MRVLDRLEFVEIAVELARRAAESDDRAEAYHDVLAGRAAHQSNEENGADVEKRRAEAIRKRFMRTVGKLAEAIFAEFPELLDALPELKAARG